MNTDRRKQPISSGATLSREWAKWAGHVGRPNDMVHYGMQLSYMVLEQIGLYQG